MQQHFRKNALAQCFGLALLAATSAASADPLALYQGPAITAAMKADPRACLNVGDAVSCSAGMLNVLAGLSPTAKGGNGFVIDSPQGLLKQSIVLGAGGAAALDNSDVTPVNGAVENAYKTNNNATFIATGKTGSTQGNLGDPDNNLLVNNRDAKGTWDVDINWLISALTDSNNLRRELMIGFDYNQPQNSTGSIDYWALITVRDVDANGNTTKQKNFEIKNDFTTGFAGFNSTKTFESQPDGSEFSTVNTVTCYKGSGPTTNSVIPSITGNCPDNTYSKVNNAQGNDTTEIIAFLPELNAGLEQLKADGYDTISVRFLLGCFNDPNVPASSGYITGGPTVHCDTGGTQDIFLLAGAPMNLTVPEPASLALVGVSLLGLVGATRRRRNGR